MKRYTDMVDEISKKNLIEQKYDFDIVKRKRGKNVIVNAPSLEFYGKKISGNVVEILKEELINTYQIDKYENICVVGLGNREILSDALGPRVLQKLFVTRGLKIQPQLCVIYPNVYAQTGIESADFVISICKEVKPDLIIFIDAFATNSLDRLGASFQITDKGIRAGSAKSGRNKKMGKEKLNADTITIGVPMLIYAEQILPEKIKKGINSHKLSDLILTPCDVKKNLNIISDIISQSLNSSIFPKYAQNEIDILLT